MFNQSGFIRLLPILFITTAVGIISFILISATAQFKGGFGSLFPQIPTHAATSTYFVDCTLGNDSNNGMAANTAWKTLSHATSITLNAGDILNIKRGCIFEGPVTISSSGIIITAYGLATDPLPEVQLTKSNTAINVIIVNGNNNTLDSLLVRADPPATVPNPDPNAGNAQLAASIRAVGCPGTGHGIPGIPYRYGIVLNGSGNTVKNSKLTELVDGVNIVGSNNKVTNNEIYNINQNGTLTVGGNDDYGSQGVEINGSNNEISYNYIHDNTVCDYDFGIDGSQIALWASPGTTVSGNKIHHNKGVHSINFTELGKAFNDTSSVVKDNTYAYNSSVNETFLVASGGGFGPTLNTTIYNNTVFSNQGGNGGISCTGGCNTLTITVRNNIFDTTGAQLWSDQPINESNNLFWNPNGGTCVTFNAATCTNNFSATDKVLDPKFINVSTSDLHLLSTSPAINAGSLASVTAGFNIDFDGGIVPTGTGVDIGAYEFGSIPFSSPTPSVTPTPNPTTTPKPASSPSICQGADFTNISGTGPDGIVNIWDYNVLIGQYNQSGTGLKADFYSITGPGSDGTVNIWDYNALVSNYGKTGC